MARRSRGYRRSSRPAYRSSRPRRSTRSRTTRGATRRSSQRVELVIRQEPQQAIAAPMVVDGGRLKVVADGPKQAKF